MTDVYSQISVYSRVGRGSTFTFTAKLERDPANQYSLHERASKEFVLSPDEVTSLRKLRVMIVDDNSTNCKRFLPCCGAFVCVCV